MNSRTLILQELQTVAPALANAPVAMAYTLPEDYFESLPLHLLQMVTRENNVLASLPKEMPYHLPADYFRQLPQQLLEKVKAPAANLKAGEENTITRQFTPVMPYSVPTDYFEQFAAAVLQKIKAEQQQQEVPQGYFESLPQSILAKVRMMEVAQELEEVAPVLNTISKQPVQSVPAGYFDNLQPQIPVQHPAEESVAPVVSIKKKTSWMRYAAAACTVFLLGLSAFFFLRNDEPATGLVEKNIPMVTNVNIDKQLASLDEATIENYLQENGSALDLNLSRFGEVEEDNIDDLLRDFTEQQLKQYLEESPVLSPTKNN